MLDLLIKSHCNIIILNTVETDRALRWVREQVTLLNRRLEELSVKPEGLEGGYTLKEWNPIDGIGGGQYSNYTDILRAILQESQPCVYFLANYHRFLREPFNIPALIQYFREIYKMEKFVHVVLQGEFNLIPEIAQYCQVIDMPLPSKDEILKTLKDITESEGLKIKKASLERSAEYLSGLTESEIKMIFKTAIVQKKGKVDPHLIQRLKAEKVKKGGLVEYIAPNETMDDLGGLGNLRKWAMMVAKVFTHREEAIKKKVPVPKGMLLAGVPGTGKTLSCKIIANLFQVPLLRVDVGKLFNSRLGETEANTRKVLKEIEAQAPAVVMIDEAEKAFSGLSSSDLSDAGTTARVISSFLYFMQENTAPLFFAFTVNNVLALPPELERRGRIDEIWFVDLPSAQERIEIIKVHLRKVGLDVKTFSLQEIAKATKGFTGAEIETVIKQAKLKGFYEGKDVTTEDIIGICKETVPLSVSRSEEIQALREWGRSRARLANSTIKGDYVKTMIF